MLALLGRLLICPAAAALMAPPLRGNLGAHDPGSVIKCKDKYYLFFTGVGILSKSSTDKIFWTGGPNVFAHPPNWTTNAAPGFTDTIWAPDIMYLNGRYCLYYAVSSLGSQQSGIGLVTNPTLDPSDPSYLWTDQGPVITSVIGSPYNTIDPSITLDANGNPWMAFGSYWNGIYVVQLDPLTGLRISPNSPTTRLAYNSSIEASCIFRRGGYYYLMADWGSCCSGVNSTYNIRMGRSTSITGPYLDRNGVDMLDDKGIHHFKENFDAKVVYGFAEDAQHQVWANVQDLGLLIFDANNFKPFENQFRLHNSSINVFTSDNTGRLIAAHESGIDFFDPSKNLYRYFDEQSGIGNKIANLNAVARYPSGEILIGTDHGLIVYFSQASGQEQPQPFISAPLTARRHPLVSCRRSPRDFA